MSYSSSLSSARKQTQRGYGKGGSRIGRRHPWHPWGRARGPGPGEHSKGDNLLLPDKPNVSKNHKGKSDQQFTGRNGAAFLVSSPVCSLLLIAQHHLSSCPLGPSKSDSKPPKRVTPRIWDLRKGWPLASREQIRLRLHTGFQWASYSRIIMKLLISEKLCVEGSR